MICKADHGKKIDKNKWTIICAEQGIGDQVLFMHSMNEAIDELGKVLYITEKRMYPIIKRSFPKMEVGSQGVTYDWTRNSLNKNGYIPLGSIPRRHRKDLNRIKNIGFLSCGPIKCFMKIIAHTLKSWQVAGQLLESHGKAGIGKYNEKQELELSNWEPIFKRNALYVNLQYGDISEEVKYLKDKNYDLVMFPKLDFKVHIDEWVAIAGACDGIISISTALVHFAGAIGQKVAVVMPGKQGPWHLVWTILNQWHTKTLKIYRPTQQESIDRLIERVSTILT